MEQEHHKEHSQFTLMSSRRFFPFFSTQFLGAFNDNLYKNALMLLLAFSGTMVWGMETNVLMNLAAGLFILPFFLFSALAGQMADKYDKSIIMRWVKLAEIIIMALAAVALISGSYAVLLLLLFAMGTQSTFFGPAKYAILPQHLEDHELVGGNALVEMGTFVAILLGTILAGILMQYDNAAQLAALGIVIIAVLGYITSRSIPTAPSANGQLKLDWNPWRTTWQVIGVTRENYYVFLAIMAISWFWFLGASYLTQFPNFAKIYLAGDASVVTLLLAIFTFGIGLGSMLCERMSGHKVELGIVPIGSLGLSIFGIDLYFAASAVSVSAELLNWSAWLDQPANVRVLIDLAGIGIFGGFFIVPLYAYIQQETPADRRARTIAGNNIMNALFMVVSAIAGMLLLGMMERSIPEFFLILAIMNIVVAAFVYQQMPDFALRFIIWIISHTMYRVSHRDLHRIPDEGPAVLVCNHVSYVDALVIAGSCRRPIRFVMDYQIFKNPVLGWFFRLAKAIPIAPKHKDEATYYKAFESISDALKEGELICIFPEGKLTRDGQINEFRQGIELIVGRDPVPVVTLALHGLWGSFFSHEGKTAFSKLPKRFWSKVSIVAGKVFPPEAVSAPELELEVRRLCEAD